jgi:hypothetical protein
MEQCFVLQTSTGRTAAVYKDADKAIEVAKELQAEFELSVVLVPFEPESAQLRSCLAESKEKQFTEYLNTPSTKYSEQLMKDLLRGARS